MTARRLNHRQSILWIAALVLVMVHMLGGLRLLVIENLDWRDGQKQLATIAAGISAIVAFVFLARLF